MSYFEVDGVKHMPFGEGSGKRICDEYGVPNLFRMPIVPELSACGDTGRAAGVGGPGGGGERAVRRHRREGGAGGGEAG